VLLNGSYLHYKEAIKEARANHIEAKNSNMENCVYISCQQASTSRQPRKLIFGMQPYFDPTNKRKKWKTTSKKTKKNGRRPQKK
jgi:hypothetical protein